MGSSDDDLTDDSNSVQDISAVMKPSYSKEVSLFLEFFISAIKFLSFRIIFDFYLKIKKIKSTAQTQLVETFEISDRSLSIYQKYTNESKISSTEFRTPKKSMSNLSSSYSIISVFSPSSNNKSVLTKTKIERLYSTNSDDFNGDPIKIINERSFNVYSNYLSVGQGGANEPSESNIKVYDSYVKSRLNESIIRNGVVFV